MKNKKRLDVFSLIVFFVLFAVLCHVGFYSFYDHKRSFVWQIDSAGQYFPSFVYIGKYLQRFFAGLIHGEIILPQYDLSIGMGESVIGTLNYYGFGDPFNLIAVFVNQNNAASLFAVSYFMRMFAAGLVFMSYLCVLNVDRRIRPLGAICYVFSGFGISGSLMYLSWGSALVLLPLLLIGIEKIIKNKKDCLLFILSVTFGALCGFYFLYMTSIALIFYCLARLISNNDRRKAIIRLSVSKDEPVRSTLYCVFHDCVFCVFAYAVGILIALPVFLPSVKAFLSSERNSSAFDIIFNYHYYVPHLSDFIGFIKASLIPSLYDFRLGILVIEWLMIIALFFMPNTKRRVQLKIAVGIVLLSASMKITGYAFNAFGETNDRYVFLVHFLVAVVLCDNLDYILSGDFLKKYGKAQEKLKFKKTGFLTVYCLVAFYLLGAANILFNMRSLFDDDSLKWNEEFVGERNANNTLKSPVCDFLPIEKDYENGEVFRVATDHISPVNDRPDNVAMINGYYGMTYWFSIVNGNVQKYVDEYNGEEMVWRSYGLNRDEYAMALAGAKYYANVYDVKFELTNNSLYKGFAYVFDSEELAQTEQAGLGFSDRSRALYEQADFSAVNDISYDNLKSIFSCKVKANDSENPSKEGRTFVTALTYDDGWKAKVNGKEVDITQTEMYCSIKIDDGENEVIIYR